MQRMPDRLGRGDQKITDGEIVQGAVKERQDSIIRRAHNRFFVNTAHFILHLEAASALFQMDTHPKADEDRD